MSGPQGYDPNTPWSGQQPSEPAWNQSPGPPPAYGQPYQQPSYGQPQYGAADQQPTAYGPSSYPQPQYGQPPAQYGQPPAQYGQPPAQYGQQPGQFGEAPPPQFAPYDAGGNSESKKSLRVIGAVVGVLLVVALIAVGVMGFWKPGWFVTTNLDITAAQSGVQKILSDETNGYGAKNVQDVICNKGANPEVKKDGTFDCEVSVDGTKRQVTVKFLDDDGTYEVGRPR